MGHLRFLLYARAVIRRQATRLRSLGKRKVFCIGRNKTGTTSLAEALRRLGIAVGEQRPTERLIRDWAVRDFRRLVRFCRTAQAFQDIPFSLPYTFQVLDAAFPGSKFILTVRDDAEQWYRSLTQYHARAFGDGRVPTIDDLKRADYCYPGWAYEVFRAVYPTLENDPYEHDTLVAHYDRHNQTVVDYFQHRRDDLLVLNVAKPGAYRRLCEFLGKPSAQEDFPWKNKTSDQLVRAHM